MPPGGSYGGGAPLGNTNARKGKLAVEALIRAIKQRDLRDGDNETLRKLVEKLLDMGIDGDLAAIREIFDRLDGKAVQQTELSGDLGLTLATLLGSIGRGPVSAAAQTAAGAADGSPSTSTGDGN